MLKTLRSDGVDVVVATPHLYLFRDSKSRFLERRSRTAEALAKAMEATDEYQSPNGESDYPKIILGAEVYFDPGLNSMNLKDLCIDGTDYLMLELPYASFTTTFMNQFANFLYTCEVKIILAHIERYFDFSEAKKVFEVLDYGLIAQGNCESIIAARTRKNTLALIDKGHINLLGTDLHDAYKRPPRFGEAERIIRKKLSDSAFVNMMKTAERILDGEQT
jgi:protein-tyrosine phosphatase